MSILDPKFTYIVEYPEAVKFTDTQLSIFWLPDEIKVEKDVQDIMVNMTEAERHGVITTLKLFTMYELIVGDEYWHNLVFKNFDRPADIQRMAKCFSFIELCVHAPFYSKINEALGLANEKFYTDYLSDPALTSRIDMLHEGASGKNIALALAHLALAEGAILYSNFAFLKHFQSKGKNKLLNIVRGINFSARDENLHSEASAWLFKTVCSEGAYSAADLRESVLSAAQIVYEHECVIIDKIFEKGKIDGITDVQMRHFVQSRINKVLGSLGYEKLYDVTYNPIADWFDNSVNSYISHDFFSGMGREYVRTWADDSFEWQTTKG